MRTRALPRAIARLCLATLLVNLFVPIAWASLLPSAEAATVACHEATDGGAPAHPGHSDPGDRTPHCPLCVLFGGTLWAPPGSAATLVGVAPAPADAPRLTASPAPALPRALRPSPRAPPASI
jgi:hypothetical protein